MVEHPNKLQNKMFYELSFDHFNSNIQRHLKFSYHEESDAGLEIDILDNKNTRIKLLDEVQPCIHIISSKTSEYHQSLQHFTFKYLALPNHENGIIEECRSM